MRFSHWLVRAAAATCGAVLLVGTFNLLVDPYMLYGVVSLPGVNANKHVAPNFSRTIKPFLVKHRQPRGLIMGSSRAEVGMDPLHPGWPDSARPVFNYAVGGVGIEELVGRFGRTLDKTRLDTVVIGLDFYMFNAYLGDLSPVYDVDGRLELYLQTLFSGAAVKDSVETLRKQDRVKYPGLLADGQIDWTFNDSRVSKHGHRNGFLRFEGHFLSDTMFPKPHKRFGFHDPFKGNDSFAHFRRLLQLAREHSIQLYFYLSPMHARLLEVYRQNGLWSEYETWKRTLVTMLAEDAAQHPGQPGFPLYDFSGINSVTVEPVPPLGDTQTRMAYYWEASHFKKEVGDLVQDRIWGTHAAGMPLPDDFGVRLTPENIEPVLAATRDGLDRYLAEHPDDYREIVAARKASRWRTTP